MRPSRTQNIGKKTPKNHQANSSFGIINKDSAFDYSFRRKIDMMENDGSNENGWQIVREGNSSGEAWATPFPLKTKSSKSLVKGDVILCRREKEFTAYVQKAEDDRYNDQQRLLRDFAKKGKILLRDTSPEITITGNGSYENNFKQRPGPTEAPMQEV